MKKVICLSVALFVTLFGQAQDAVLDSIEHRVETVPDTLVAITEMEAAIYYLNRSTDQCLHFVRRALLSAGKMRRSGDLAKAWNLYGAILRRTGEPDSAAYAYRQALHYAIDSHDTTRIYQVYNNSAYLYNKTGNVDSALYYYDQSLEMAAAARDSAMMEMVWNNKGGLMRDRGEPAEAMRCYETALQMALGLDDQRAIARAYNNMALVLRNEEKYTDAQGYFEQAVAINRDLEDLRGQAIALNGLGTVYDAQGQWEQAIVHLEEALSLAEELKHPGIILSVVNNLARSLMAGESFAEARVYNLRSLELSEQLGDEEGVIANLNMAGEIHEKLEEWRDGISYYERSIAFNAKGDYVGFLKDSYHGLSNCLAGAGRWEDAYAARTRYESLNDSLKTVAKTAEIEEINARYQTESAKQEAALAKTDLDKSNAENELLELRSSRQSTIIWWVATGGVLVLFLLLYVMFTNRRLQAQKKEIQSQKDELHQVNRTKDKLLSIVAHDLKNPFGVLQSMTRMLVDRFDDLKDGQKKEIAQTVHGSFTSTYDLVDNLLMWSRTQSGPLQVQPERIALAKLVEENLSLVQTQANSKEITLEARSLENLAINADRNMLTTVVRNLLTNALKFTSKGGTVSVYGRDEEGQIELVVEDTGLGIAAEDIPRLFDAEGGNQMVGNSPEKGTGLGLPVCKEFVEAQGGKISVQSIPGKGSKFIVSIPKA